jgi:hypothetical protein
LEDCTAQALKDVAGDDVARRLIFAAEEDARCWGCDVALPISTMTPRRLLMLLCGARVNAVYSRREIQQPAAEPEHNTGASEAEEGKKSGAGDGKVVEWECRLEYLLPQSIHAKHSTQKLDLCVARSTDSRRAAFAQAAGDAMIHCFPADYEGIRALRQYRALLTHPTTLKLMGWSEPPTIVVGSDPNECCFTAAATLHERLSPTGGKALTVHTRDSKNRAYAAAVDELVELAVTGHPELEQVLEESVATVNGATVTESIYEDDVEGSSDLPSAQSSEPSRWPSTPATQAPQQQPHNVPVWQTNATLVRVSVESKTLLDLFRIAFEAEGTLRHHVEVTGTTHNGISKGYVEVTAMQPRNSLTPVLPPVRTDFIGDPSGATVAAYANMVLPAIPMSVAADLTNAINRLSRAAQRYIAAVPGTPADRASKMLRFVCETELKGVHSTLDKGIWTVTGKLRVGVAGAPIDIDLPLADNRSKKIAIMEALDRLHSTTTEITGFQLTTYGALAMRPKHSLTVGSLRDAVRRLARKGNTDVGGQDAAKVYTGALLPSAAEAALAGATPQTSKSAPSDFKHGVERGWGMPQASPASSDFGGLTAAVLAGNPTCALHAALLAIGIRGRFDTPRVHITTLGDGARANSHGRRGAVAVRGLTMSASLMVRSKSGESIPLVTLPPAVAPLFPVTDLLWNRFAVEGSGAARQSQHGFPAAADLKRVPANVLPLINSLVTLQLSSVLAADADDEDNVFGASGGAKDDESKDPAALRASAFFAVVSCTASPLPADGNNSRGIPRRCLL